MTLSRMGMTVAQKWKALFSVSFTSVSAHKRQSHGHNYDVGECEEIEGYPEPSGSAEEKVPCRRMPILKKIYCITLASLAALIQSTELRPSLSEPGLSLSNSRVK